MRLHSVRSGLGCSACGVFFKTYGFRSDSDTSHFFAPQKIEVPS